MDWTKEGIKKIEKEVEGIKKISYTEQPQKIMFEMSGTEKAYQKVREILERSKPIGLSITVAHITT